MNQAEKKRLRLERERGVKNATSFTTTEDDQKKELVVVKKVVHGSGSKEINL